MSRRAPSVENLFIQGLRDQDSAVLHSLGMLGGSMVKVSSSIDSEKFHPDGSIFLSFVSGTSLPSVKGNNANDRHYHYNFE